MTTPANQHLEQLRAWRYDPPGQRTHPEALIAWARQATRRVIASGDVRRRDQSQLVQEQVMALLGLAARAPAWQLRYATALGDQLHPTLQPLVEALPLWRAPVAAFLDAVHVVHPVEPELGPQQWASVDTIHIPAWNHGANAWAPFHLTWQPGRNVQFVALEANYTLSWAETRDAYTHLAVDPALPSGAILVVDLLCAAHTACRRLGHIFAGTRCACAAPGGTAPGCPRCGGSGMVVQWWVDEEP